MRTAKRAAPAGIGLFDRVAGECAKPLWGSGRPSVSEMRYCGKPCGRAPDRFGRRRFLSYCPDCSDAIYSKAAPLSVRRFALA